MLKYIFVIIFLSYFLVPVYADEFLYCDIVYRNGNRPSYAREEKSQAVFQIDYSNNKIYRNNRLLKSKFSTDEITIIDDDVFNSEDLIMKWTYIINRYTGNLTGTFYEKIKNREDTSSITGICLSLIHI